MSDPKPAAIRAADIPARTGTIYPKPYDKGFEGRAKRALGDVFGLSQFGVNLTVLAPGSASSQRHWHEREDEFIYVLDGEVTLIGDTGELVLTAGMCAGFKAGVPNGHQLVNRSSVPASILEVGTRSDVETAHYSDAAVDMKAIKQNGRFQILHKDGTPY
ncbi:MAG TPA: cupin domain-containing protein [Aestuariivirga sp.]|nr:cupin domain-containing protein [Aestuariivirga sp.]